MQRANGVGCIGACACVAAARRVSGEFEVPGTAKPASITGFRPVWQEAVSDHRSRKRCESSAAMHPVPALVMACR